MTCASSTCKQASDGRLSPGSKASAAVTVIPKLEGEAQAAVTYRGGHLQIIASAGSGKTEVVSQRVAALCAEGIEPAGIVAFTFTERAAASLKSRIERCVLADPRLGEPYLDRLGGMFVGTIHSYCFGLLQSMCRATKPSMCSTITG